MMKTLVSFYILFALILTTSTVGLSAGKLTLRGNVFEHPDPIRACEITIFKQGSSNIHAKSNDKGEFSVILDVGNDYLIEFSKRGYVTKKIKVTSAYMSNTEKNYGMDGITIDLFKTEGSYNYNILKNPIANIKFKSKTDDFGYDVKYNTKIQEKVQTLWYEVREVRVKRDKEYNEAIKQADQYFNEKDYPNAKIFYELALEYREMAVWPYDQIKLINGLIEASEEVEEEVEIEIVDNAISTKEEVTKKGNKIITKRYVRQGKRTIKYHSVENKHGQIYYFKKNFPITFSTWYSESTKD